MKTVKKILSCNVITCDFNRRRSIVWFLSKTKYEGEVQLKSIQDQTTVYFDDFGVPHIYANNSIDAMTALGYVHAQDRLWQMELMRRIAPGRLSEIFGK
jgi:penicillin amidase